MTPLQFGLRNIALDLSSATSFYKNLKQIRDENLILLDKVETLENRLLDTQKAESENTLLKEQLKLKNTLVNEKELLMVGVLGNPSDKTGSSIVIDQGSRNGIKKGNNVILGDKLIGVVSNVSPGRSVVDLIVSSKVLITAYDIDSVDKTEGLVTGEFGTSVVMSKILPDEHVNVGDKILSSGRDGTFEPGLLIGTISLVEGQTSEPLRRVFLQPAADFSKLEKVFVILY